jgi:hypothetical protein
MRVAAIHRKYVVTKGPIPDQKLVHLEGFLMNLDRAKRHRWLVLFEVINGKLSVFQGYPAPEDKAVYLVNALKLEGAESTKRLDYFFRYLEHADEEIARDVNREFANAEYRDLRKAATGFAPERSSSCSRIRKSTTFIEPLSMHSYWATAASQSTSHSSADCWMIGTGASARALS